MSIDLSKINSIEKVADSFVYSKWGELLAPQLPYKDARVQQFGKEVALYSLILEKIKQEIDFIELIYEERRIIVRISQKFFILVICENTADTTLIKLNLNVLNEEIKSDKTIQKSLQKLPGEKDFLTAASEDAELQELLTKLNITA
jgi:hypothetical protein